MSTTAAASLVRVRLHRRSAEISSQWVESVVNDHTLLPPEIVERIVARVAAGNDVTIPAPDLSAARSLCAFAGVMGVDGRLV
jgi:hypothetical protein